MNNDQIILDDFRKGELDLFYQKIFPGLVVFTERYLGEENELLAKDCVQETILKTWERREDFTTFNSFKNFLYVSVRNAALNILRQKKTESNYLQQLADPVFFDNAVIDQEAQLILTNAINGLPENIRKVFEHLFLDEMKTKEVAEIMGISDRYVKQLKAKALEHLRKQLDPGMFSVLCLLVESRESIGEFRGAGGK